MEILAGPPGAGPRWGINAESIADEGKLSMKRKKREAGPPGSGRGKLNQELIADED